MKMMATPTSEEFRIRIERVKNKLIESPENVLNHFGIRYRDLGNRLTGCCPCHDGSDNDTALSIMMEGYIGAWICWTRSCEETYGKDLLGLVWGILSKRAGKRVLFTEVLNYCEEKIGIGEYNGVELDLLNLSKKFQTNEITQQIVGSMKSLNNLDIPSKYYLKKGFSPDILKQFHIGDCWNPQKPMFGRAVCPIFDLNQNIIGAAGRIIEEKEYLQKWKYSYNFKASSYFYGFWAALPLILERKEVILVEGQMDVVKLHEYGAKNTIGCFGAHITDKQIELLNKYGVQKVKILMDGDTAGYEAALRIENKCSDYFNTEVIKLKEGQDPDELSKEEIERLL